MAMTKKTEKTQYEQDAANVAEMLDYYTKHFDEVHKLTCGNCLRVIAVEVAPMRNEPVMLLKKQRNLFTFNDLCLSVRERDDVTDEKKPMFGYQCACGNNTLVAQVEQGEVAQRTIVRDKAGNIVSDSGAIAATSPFERAQAQASIRIKQASGKVKADYETDGTKERYETFTLERVK